jgi:hypothetical protein
MPSSRSRIRSAVKTLLLAGQPGERLRRDEKDRVAAKLRRLYLWVAHDALHRQPSLIALKLNDDRRPSRDAKVS